MVPHHVCPTCGFYAGRQVVEVKTREEKPNA
jgi:ribosomal protein L32